MTYDDFTWGGRTYYPGQFISEALYEELIDAAYGVGDDLRNTTIWKGSYERGFAFPDGTGGWVAFALDGSGYCYIGRFDQSDLFGPDEKDLLSEAYDMLEEAEHSPVNRAIDLLRRVYVGPYFKTEQTKVGLEMANDPECLDWFADYWYYVRMIEHGNEPSLEEVGFGGLVDSVLDPEPTLEYLTAEGDQGGFELARRLERLNKKYANRGGKRRWRRSSSQLITTRTATPSMLPAPIMGSGHRR